ncbi:MULTISPECIES: tyrosine-protein phosphatase [Microbacterium]|uniref:tyrosine-protein phosphatase n=1 Tax=Microbacterium TaxID=33882 RepID=UPI00277F4743|nr:MULTISPECIES: tyrosine-protein phosphatase [Microbacterium]MDQ1073910.1 protein-tyrosine phosphatase [Microbacterium sp. SORGH_AS_0969]MDQ1114139.1 protein-tyrosine phosphatase [Microbacterium testaceum]
MTSLVSGAANFRDVGGLPAGDRRTRAGVLFRSGNLVAVDDDGIDTLRALGIRRVIDLRDETELAHAPSRFDDLPVEVQHEPLFLGSVDSFFARDVTLDELYAELVEESAERIVSAVRGILKAQPVLVHCTVGKDRTGVTVAIALAAAGVDREAVVADYARTEALLPPERNAAVLRAIRAFHPENVNAEALATRSPAPAMRALLDRLDRAYGSPAGYLRAHGMSDDEVRRLHDVLID